MSNNKSRRMIYLVTFTVAFCSIAYELVYSELLRVVFGGTVLRYSITIGLYLASLGLGAFLFNDLKETKSNFLRVEILLSIAGPAGVLLILLINSFPWIVNAYIPESILTIISHSPVVIVGLLSGFEIPLLTSILNKSNENEQNNSTTSSRLIQKIGGIFHNITYGILSIFFIVKDRDTIKNKAYSEVLGVDYIGSLAGTVIYALILYPTLGLITTVFVLGLLNALVALLFATQTTSFTSIIPDKKSLKGIGLIEGEKVRVFFMVGILLTSMYAGSIAKNDMVSGELTEMYYKGQIRDEYTPGDVNVSIIEHKTTRYQNILLYERKQSNNAGNGSWETCLRLDNQLQLCDSWVESYHAGLVDVPMSLFENPEDKRVLIVGGGDYIAIDRLRDYNVTIDQVDIDREFLQYTRNHSYFEQYHNNAYRYDNLNTHVGDIFTYLRENDRNYDVILLDIPGARNDDMLELYSTEFYQLLRHRLTDEGVVVTWSYSRYVFPSHHKAYMNTVNEAGFTSYMSYVAYADTNNDGDDERGEGFYILSPNPEEERSLSISNKSTDELRDHRSYYNSLSWRATPRYRGISPNSVFHPNYDIIIEID